MFFSETAPAKRQGDRIEKFEDTYIATFFIIFEDPNFVVK